MTRVGSFIRRILRMMELSVELPSAAAKGNKRGYNSNLVWMSANKDVIPARRSNPPNVLRTFFDSRMEGNGIWKWNHYFDIYDRHFAQFRGKEVHVLEIGVYSGGSLEMWRDYFGPKARIYGVDIESACRAYERPARNELSDFSQL